MNEDNNNQQKANLVTRTSQTDQKSRIAGLQEQLYGLGAFDKGIPYDTAVDSIQGPQTNRAIEKAKSMGYVVKDGALVPSDNRTNSSDDDGTGFIDQTVQFLKNLTNKATDYLEDIFSNGRQYNNTAIYLHYPNFKGKASNAVVVGGVDIGKKVLGTGDVLPVGHDELITFDNNGTAHLIRYGRYKTGIGHVRPTIKGGNWNIIQLSPRNSGESVQEYVSRIKGSLEDSKYGKFEAIEVPNVNSADIIEYARTQSKDKNRPEYSVINTCATGATEALRAGLSTIDKIRMTVQPNFEFLSGAEDGIPTSLWGLFVPGSTNQYAHDVRRIGNSHIIK